jgi:hypothetical protein
MLEESCCRAFFKEQGHALDAHCLYGAAYELEKPLSEHGRRWFEQQLGESASGSTQQLAIK